MKRDEVRANRQKWIDYLKAPERQKAVGVLEHPRHPEQRCCLGHGCHVLGIPKESKLTQILYGGNVSCAPKQLILLVGLLSNTGETTDDNYSLVGMNDHRDMSPQEIGAYLEEHIEGGGPFLPLTDYAE